MISINREEGKSNFIIVDMSQLDFINISYLDVGIHLLNLKMLLASFECSVFKS